MKLSSVYIKMELMALDGAEQENEILLKAVVDAVHELADGLKEEMGRIAAETDAVVGTKSLEECLPQKNRATLLDMARSLAEHRAMVMAKKLTLDEKMTTARYVETALTLFAQEGENGAKRGESSIFAALFRARMAKNGAKLVPVAESGDDDDRGVPSSWTARQRRFQENLERSMDGNFAQVVASTPQKGPKVQLALDRWMETVRSIQSSFAALSLSQGQKRKGAHETLLTKGHALSDEIGLSPQEKEDFLKAVDDLFEANFPLAMDAPAPLIATQTTLASTASLMTPSSRSDENDPYRAPKLGPNPLKNEKSLLKAISGSDKPCFFGDKNPNTTLSFRSMMENLRHVAEEAKLNREAVFNLLNGCLGGEAKDNLMIFKNTSYSLGDVFRLLQHRFAPILSKATIRSRINSILNGEVMGNVSKTLLELYYLHQQLETCSPNHLQGSVKPAEMSAMEDTFAWLEARNLKYLIEGLKQRLVEEETKIRANEGANLTERALSKTLIIRLINLVVEKIGHDQAVGQAVTVASVGVQQWQAGGPQNGVLEQAQMWPAAAESEQRIASSMDRSALETKAGGGRDQDPG